MLFPGGSRWPDSRKWGRSESAPAIQVFPSAAVDGRYELYRPACPSER